VNLGFKSKLSGKTFTLVGTINVPFLGHFNCIMIDPVLFCGEKLNGSWIHDGLENNGSIVRYGNLSEIYKINPYILIYKSV